MLIRINKKINIGIIGCGFVGGALKDWLEHNIPECKLFINDTHSYVPGPDGKFGSGASVFRRMLTPLPND